MTRETEQTSGPRFVDGIGPPLRQIQEDYSGERTTAARDVLALIAEVERLERRVAELQEALRDIETKAFTLRQAQNRASRVLASPGQADPE